MIRLPFKEINTFNKIVYMDWIFGLGYAQLKENNNSLYFKSFGIDKTSISQSHSGIMWEAGMKFYLDQSFSARLDLTAVHYKAISLSGSSLFYSNFDATVSLGYSF